MAGRKTNSSFDDYKSYIVSGGNPSLRSVQAELGIGQAKAMEYARQFEAENKAAAEAVFAEYITEDLKNAWESLAQTFVRRAEAHKQALTKIHANTASQIDQLVSSNKQLEQDFVDARQNMEKMLAEADAARQAAEVAKAAAEARAESEASLRSDMETKLANAQRQIGELQAKLESSTNRVQELTGKLAEVVTKKAE